MNSRIMPIAVEQKEAGKETAARLYAGRSIAAHDCLKHLNNYCQCKICGQFRHNIVSDRNYSGTGPVTERCIRCQRSEKFYDDAGAVLSSDLYGK